MPLAMMSSLTNGEEFPELMLAQVNHAERVQ